MVVSVQDIQNFFNLLLGSLGEDSVHFELGVDALDTLHRLHTRIKELPDLSSPERDIEATMEALIRALHPKLAQEKNREVVTISFFLKFIKTLYKNRWESHLSRLPDAERLPKSWNDPHWKAMTDNFESLLESVVRHKLISREDYETMPLRVVKDADGARAVLDRCELYFPGQKSRVDSYFRVSIGSYHANTGLFWLPKPEDVGPRNELLPVRLYTPFEEFLLTERHSAQFMSKYLPYLVTSERVEPSVTELTINELQKWTQVALLIEKEVTRTTHPKEVRALIARQTKADKLAEYAQQMSHRKADVEAVIAKLSDESPATVEKKRWLQEKYLYFVRQHAYDYALDIEGDLKQALLIALAAVQHKEVSEFEAEIESAVTRRLANLSPTDLYHGERALQDEYIEYYTELFVSALTNNVKLSSLEEKDSDAPEKKRVKQIKRDFFMRLNPERDEETGELVVGSALPKPETDERHRLDNQVFYLGGIPIDNQAMIYATFDRLVYLMAPEHRVLSACAHTIWGAFLVLLVDYFPERNFGDWVERRYSERLPMLRERSRGKVCMAPLVMTSDEEEESKQGERELLQLSQIGFDLLFFGPSVSPYDDCMNLKRGDEGVFLVRKHGSCTDLEQKTDGDADSDGCKL